MKKNDEIQSRREFFKNAAKKALPILGAVALMSMPNIVKSNAISKNPSSTCEVCTGLCTGCTGCTSCSGWCEGACRGGCTGSCLGCTSCSINCAGNEY